MKQYKRYMNKILGIPIIQKTSVLRFLCSAILVNSFLASGDFCQLLITFANKQFGPRSGPTESRPRSGSKLFEILIVFRIFEGGGGKLKNVSRRQKSMKNYPVCKDV